MTYSNNSQLERQATFTLAIHQHSPTPAAINQSLNRLEEQAHRAAAGNAQLLLVPEASLTGYNIPLATAQAVAVERDGRTAEKIHYICQRANIGLAYGYIEREGRTLFNSVQVLDNSGVSIAHYRKTHLWGELDRSVFKAGQALSPVFQIGHWQVGVLICYDIEFPETVRHLALQGAELILTPTALMHPWSFVAQHVTRVRAAENQVYIAYANYCHSENDIEYVGCSCIVGPDGFDLARAQSEPELIIATLNKEAISDIRTHVPYHQDRRPELYQLGRQAQ